MIKYYSNILISMLINIISIIFILLTSLITFLLMYRPDITVISLWQWLSFLLTNIMFCISIFQSGKGISKMSSEMQVIKKDTNATNITYLLAYNEFNLQSFYCLIGFCFYLSYITGFMIR